MAIKRINLSFNLNRDLDAKVYELINNEPRKTEYIIKAIMLLVENEKDNNCISKDIIKLAVKEVLSELNVDLKELNNNVEEKVEKLPNEIFDLFDSI